MEECFCSCKAEKKDPKAEFRRDVCAFANSDGGYLVYGISEKNGIPEKITGITIPNNNPDNFELQLNNTLCYLLGCCRLSTPFRAFHKHSSKGFKPFLENIVCYTFYILHIFF